MHRPIALRAVVAVAGKAERLSTTNFVVPSAEVRALPTNSADIHLGPSSVSAKVGFERGYILRPGEALPMKDVDLYDWWIDSTASGEGVSIGATV